MKKIILGTLIGFILLPSIGYAAPRNCECIRYIREVHGVNIRGNAWTIQGNINPLNMDYGDVVLIGRDHGALIIGSEGEQWYGNVIVPEYIWIADTNYVRPCTPSVRKIAWNNPAIRGVYSPA